MSLDAVLDEVVVAADAVADVVSDCQEMNAM